MKTTSLWQVVIICAIVSSHCLGTAAVCHSTDRKEVTAVAWDGYSHHSTYIQPSPETNPTVESWTGFGPVLESHGLHSSGPGGWQTLSSLFSRPDANAKCDILANALPRVPAEFERQEALVLVAGGLAEQYPAILASIITAAQRRVKLVGLVASSQQRTTCGRCCDTRDYPRMP